MPPKSNSTASRNALRYLLREARKAGVVLSNAFATPNKRTANRPYRYVKTIHKGNFVKRKVPIHKPTQSDVPTVPKLPPLGPQTVPKPLKHVAAEPAASGGGATSSQSSTTTSSTQITQQQPSRMYNWWKQNAAVLVLNFGSLCTLTGFMRSDVLELRALSMTGSLSSVVYFLLLQPIRWAPIAWSTLFAAVNGEKIYKILYERNAEVHLTLHEEAIFVEHFMPSGVTPKQFELITKRATTKLYKQGQVIVKQGDPLDHVYLVVKGKTRAQYMGRRLTAVSSAPGHRQHKVGGDAGAWIGEMTFLETFGLKEMKKEQESRLTGRAIYTIEAASDCEVLVWSHDDVEALMKSSTDLRASMTRAMTAPIVGKVINFTVSMGNRKGTWATWLNDWSKKGDNTEVHVEQKEETPGKEEELEELEPVM